MPAAPRGAVLNQTNALIGIVASIVAMGVVGASLAVTAGKNENRIAVLERAAGVASADHDAIIRVEGKVDNLGDNMEFVVKRLGGHVGRVKEPDSE